jgi:hypothetical protein
VYISFSSLLAVWWYSIAFLVWFLCSILFYAILWLLAFFVTLIFIILFTFSPRTVSA